VAFFIIFLGLLFGACLFALWRGGGPERAIAALFLIAWLASIATRAPFQRLYQGVAYHTLAIDTLLFVSLLIVTRRANRKWPVLVTGLQLLVALAHLARILMPFELPVVYMIMTAAWPFIQLITVLAGTAFHWRRTAIHGAEASWTNSPPSPPPTTPPPSGS
jgi:hypothetical protein